MYEEPKRIKTNLGNMKKLIGTTSTVYTMQDLLSNFQLSQRSVVFKCPNAKITDATNLKSLIGTDGGIIPKGTGVSAGQVRNVSEQVWIEAPEMLDGKYFNYYVDNKYNIVSYNSKQDFVIYSDIMCIPIYSNKKVKSSDIVSIIGNTYLDYVNNNFYLTVTAYRKIYSSFTSLTWGLLYANSKSVSDDKFIFNGQKVAKVELGSSSNPNSIYDVSFNAKNWVNSGKRYSFRVYCILNQNNKQVIKYSDIIKVQF